MSVTIDKSFVDHFQADVHQAYQRMGSKLRNTVRVKNSVKGASTVFQKVGKGTATTKARHGKVPVTGSMRLMSSRPITMKRWFWPMPGPMRWVARPMS